MIYQKYTNDTDYNDTDYIKTENNDMDDLNDKKSTYPVIIQIIQITTIQTLIMRLLKFQLLEELPQSIQNYLSNFEVVKLNLLNLCY